MLADLSHFQCGAAGPVGRLPVLLSQDEEDLIRAVQLLPVLHPDDVRLGQAFHSAAQPHLVPLRHCLIGRVLREEHACRRGGHFLNHSNTTIYIDIICFFSTDEKLFIFAMLIRMIWKYICSYKLRGLPFVSIS